MPWHLSQAPHLACRGAGPFVWRFDPAPAAAPPEEAMAKGQMRSNKEIKKPKAKKPAAGPATSNLKLKGSLTPINLPKKG